ncbi:MAG: hypothetical protein Hyperionvirus20_37 [Hyperionvirus sp.]|uniref:Uncharacterized protein n=1 Tax=Hyperionvirus sp. TaxID=2487770 RepID=A0A3G5AFU8_9VIRU|nr:MAG: hypothetical protein Hyperionvirus20_37 [Hyperionvirus sp.]
MVKIGTMLGERDIFSESLMNVSDASISFFFNSSGGSLSSLSEFRT